MRYFGQIVQLTTCDMKMGRAKRSKHSTVGAQLVSDNLIWDVFLFFLKFPHTFKGRVFVSTRLGKDLKDLPSSATARHR